MFLENFFHWTLETWQILDFPSLQLLERWLVHSRQKLILISSWTETYIYFNYYCLFQLLSFELITIYDMQNTTRRLIFNTLDTRNVKRFETKLNDNISKCQCIDNLSTRLEGSVYCCSRSGENALNVTRRELEETADGCTGEKVDSLVVITWHGVTQCEWLATIENARFRLSAW